MILHIIPFLGRVAAAKHSALRQGATTQRWHHLPHGGYPLLCPQEPPRSLLLLPEWSWSYLGLHPWPGLRCQARGMSWTSICGCLGTWDPLPNKFQSSMNVFFFSLHFRLSRVLPLGSLSLANFSYAGALWAQPGDKWKTNEQCRIETRKLDMHLNRQREINYSKNIYIDNILS